MAGTLLCVLRLRRRGNFGLTCTLRNMLGLGPSSRLRLTRILRRKLRLRRSSRPKLTKILRRMRWSSNLRMASIPLGRCRSRPRLSRIGPHRLGRSC